MTGKAAIFHEAGKPFEVRELPLPKLEPEAVLVRVTVASICGSDLHIWRGDQRGVEWMARGPRIIGHEMAGRVQRLGADVRTDTLGQPLAEGDRVVYPYFFPCRRCYVCLRGQLAACPNKARRAGVDEPPHFTGAYAEYFHLPPGHFIFKVPEELSDEMIAPVNCALSQVIYGLRQAGLQFGDTLVIQGAGGLGLNAAAVAKEMGAERVIAIDGMPERLRLARECGADNTIDINEHPSPRDRIDQVLALTGGRGADVVAELVGRPQVVSEGVAMVRNGGAYLEIGNISPGHTTDFDPSQLVWGNKRMVGIINYDPWVIPVALAFLQRTREKYPLHRVISHKFPLERINEAFQQAEWATKDTAVTRAVITP